MARKTLEWADVVHAVGISPSTWLPVQCQQMIFSGHRRPNLGLHCLFQSRRRRAAVAESSTIVLSFEKEYCDMITWMKLRTKHVGMEILVTWVIFFTRVICNSGWHDPTWENISYSIGGLGRGITRVDSTQPNLRSERSSTANARNGLQPICDRARMKMRRPSEWDEVEAARREQLMTILPDNGKIHSWLCFIGNYLIKHFSQYFVLPIILLLSFPHGTNNNLLFLLGSSLLQSRKIPILHRAHHTILDDSKDC